MSCPRSIPVLAAAALLALAAPASADTVISFTDLQHDVRGGVIAGGAGLGFDVGVAWTQTVSLTNASLSAYVMTDGAPSDGNWWLTRMVGPTATPADVVASGKYQAAHLAPLDGFDFNTVTPVLIASGLDLSPGSYFLVVGPAAGDTAYWIADQTLTHAAPGFTPAGAFQSRSPAVPFGPSADIEIEPSLNGLPYVLTGTVGSVPEPGGWALMIEGLGLAGGALRRRSVPVG